MLIIEIIKKAGVYMKRWKTSTTLMLGLLVGGVIASQANNALADSSSTIADNIQTESKFNNWENSLDAMDIQAYDAETGEDLTDKLDKSKLTDDKLLFNSARKANAVFGYHDKMTDEEATKYTDQLLDNYLTKDGFLKVSNSNVQTYKNNAVIKGYTLVFIRAREGEHTKFYYVPDKDASKYQSFDQIARLDKGDSLLTFIGKPKDDKEFQLFKQITVPLLTQNMQLLYNSGTPKVPDAKSDNFSDNSSSAIDSSSPDRSSAAESSSSSIDSDSASDLPNVNSSEKAQASEAASQAISQLSPATTTASDNSDTQASNVSDDDSDSDLSPATSDDDTSDTNSPSDNAQANRNSTAVNPSASSSSQPAQTASSVANSQNNQTLPQTGNNVKANLIFGISGGIVALTGAYIIANRKNVR